MKRRSKTLLAMAVMVMAAALPLFAQANPQPQHGRPGPGPVVHCLSILDLTDAQKEAIRAVIEGSADTLRALHEKLRTDQQALQALLDAATPDACAIGNAALTVKADRVAIKAELDEVRAAVGNLLTAEQKLKFAGCIEGQERGNDDAPPPPPNGNGRR
jgi:Spy/CpxP family protein refolding chaperone